MARDEVPTSRVRRSAAVGRLAASEALKHFGTRAANIARGHDAAEHALERRQLDTAKQIVAALGTMKGAAMKIGQVMSFLDVGLVPEPYRDDFQRELARLRDAAPTVSLASMRKVIESELEEPLGAIFADFDPEPIAAASIGQVYRAQLHDGRDVAVKVQYPGVAAAVNADIQNLNMILRLMRRLAPKLDAKATAEEIRVRIGEELDYELEAQNQRRMARIYRGHPFIRIPDVVTSLTRTRVMVSEYIQGTGFEVLKGYPPSERNRIGEIIFRFFFGSMYRYHEFSGDPHPGNFLLQDDGRVAFLDFGLFKRIEPDVAERELGAIRLARLGDAQGLVEHLHAGGFLPEPDGHDPQRILDQARGLMAWYLVDEEVELDPETATQVAIDMSDPRSRFYSQMRDEALPPDHLFGRRLELLTLAVLGQLRARANWFAIASEWIYDAEPVTELGRADAEFRASLAA